MDKLGKLVLDKEGALFSFAVRFTKNDLVELRNKDTSVNIKDLKKACDEKEYDYILAFIRILMFEMGLTPNKMPQRIVEKKSKKKRPSLEEPYGVWFNVTNKKKRRKVKSK